MFKKILISVFALMLFSLPAYAADIIVQGEDYVRSYTNTPIYKLPEGSENPVMVISQWKGANMKYTVEYDFNAEVAGGYELSAVVSEIDSAYTSNFYYSVNGGEYVYSGDVFKKISNPGTAYANSSMYLYTLGTAELKKGTNTIKFMVDESREISEAWAEFYIDYFTLSKREFGLYSVTASKPSAVFEESDSAKFTVQFTDYPDKEKSYGVLVEDYFHNIVAEKTFVLKTDAMKAELDFGKLASGWYRLIISDGKTDIYNSGFSVVHNTEEREENTHFAIDFAGMVLTSGKTEVQRLARAIRLAGIDTVRERYYWSYSDTLRKYYNETIASEGLKVINMFCDSPSRLVTNGYMADDLFEVYNFQKNYAESYDGLVDIMEIWNEEDTSFATETADRYSSFLKAAAIGIADGSSVMEKTLGGFAGSPADTRYMDFCMMNDCMEYSDLYNYHAYASGGNDYENAPSLGKAELHANRDILTAYGYDDRRSWVTEGGIALEEVNERSRRQQARASVINNVQSVANGNDKHFLFVVPQYYESGREYGIFLEDGTPSPAYSSLENLTYILGEAEYKGIFKDLPENVCGYLFNNGKKDVGVFWAENGERFVQVASDKSVILADIMGNQSEISPINGIISIPVTQDPVYLIFNSTVGEDLYARFQKETAEFKNADISENKKIVIQQKFEGRSYVDERNKGYLIYKGEDNICTLKVYNFTNRDVSGVINAKISDNFTIDKNRQTVEIPAMQSAEIQFAVRTAENAEGSEKGFLQFSGNFNGEEITRSTSVIRYRMKDDIELEGRFARAKKASLWQTGKTSSSGTVTASDTDNENEVKFNIELDGNGWAYPNFKVTENSELTGSTGIKFTVGAEADVGQAIMHCFVYMTDGRKYFEGNAEGKTISAGYTSYYFPWNEMKLQHLPDGVSADKEFALEDIAYIGIGVNMSGTKSVQYSLKDIGWYVSDADNDVQHWDTLAISGAEDGSVYYKGRTPSLTASLPDTDSIKTVNVYLSGKKYGDYSISGNSALIDISSLDAGVYTLLVTAENEFGYIYRSSLDFIIQ